MFDIHKVKPVHGWREFVGEVGIIVLGVLIALGCEQIVEALSWRERVSKTEESLKVELSNQAYVAAGWRMAAPCVQAQINVLKTKVLESGPRFKPAPLFSGLGYRNATIVMPDITYSTDVWQTANTDDVSSHLPPDIRTELAEAYTNVRDIATNNRQNDATTARMSSLGSPLEINAQTRLALLNDLNELWGRVDFDDAVSGQLLGQIQRAGMMPPVSELRMRLQQSPSLLFCTAHHISIRQIEQALSGI